MLPRWSVALIVFICLAMPTLFLWAWKQKGESFAPVRVRVTWVKNYGSGTYGYLANLEDFPLHKVTMMLEKPVLTGQNGFVTGTATETLFPKWVFRENEPEYHYEGISRTCSIPAGSSRRFDFLEPIVVLPAEITVTVNGQKASVSQEIR